MFEREILAHQLAYLGRAPERWGAPAQDYATDPGAPSGWAAADPPAVALPAVEPVTLRTGWLTAARPGGDAASPPRPATL